MQAKAAQPAMGKPAGAGLAARISRAAGSVLAVVGAAFVLDALEFAGTWVAAAWIFVAAAACLVVASIQSRRGVA